MPINLGNLIKKVKESKLLSENEKKDWLKKMETMKDKDLAELESILDYAAGIDFEKAVPQYEERVRKAEQICEKAEQAIDAMCQSVSPA